MNIITKIKQKLKRRKRSEVEDIKIDDFHYSKETGLDIKMRHPMFVLFSKAVCGFFKDYGGENLVVTGIRSEGDDFTITIEKWGKKNLSTVYVEKCQELEKAKTEIERLTSVEK